MNTKIKKESKKSLKKEMKKTFILDTNVLLSDSECLRSFQDNDVVLPLIVVEELDRFKDKQDDVGKHAREISRQLIELVKENRRDVKKGISLGKEYGVLKILNQKDLESNVIISIPELDYSKGDNKIVQFCLEYKQKFSEEKVILVTRDLLLRIKAISVGIECEDYKKLSKDIAKISNMPASESEFFTGVKTFKVSKEELDKFYEEKNNIILTEEEEKGLYPNQFIVFESNETDAKIAGRFLKPGKPLKFVSFQQSAWNIKNKNMEQAFLMDLLMDDSVSLVTVNSRSGAGKTLISLACALELTLTKRKYNKILITRNIQPLGKDIGALPGTTEEKLSPWIAPFKDNLEFLLNENIDDAVAKGAVKSKKSENLKHSFGMQDLFERGIIQIEATTFIRGRSIPKCIFLVDESQNLSLHEMKTILTRVGEGTKIVLLGDYNQIDSTYLNKFTNGLTIATEKFKNEEVAGHVTLVKGERSKLATIASDIL